MRRDPMNENNDPSAPLKPAAFAPSFARGQGGPADGLPGAVRSLKPTGANEAEHPRGEGVTTGPKDLMPRFSMLDATREMPWETIGSKKIEGVGEIVVLRTANSHFVVKHRFEQSSLRRLWPCETKHEVMKVLYRKFDAGKFAELCWAFLGKVF